MSISRIGLLIENGLEENGLAERTGRTQERI
jgi:hypothetical protein